MLTSSSLEKKGVKFIEASFLDLHGIMRSRTFPVKRFDAISEEGFGFDGSSVGFVEIEDSDIVARPLEKTCKILSFDSFRTAFFLCEIIKDGKPFKGSGRGILKDTLEKIKTENYRVFVGPELEFFITKDGKPIDDAGYMFSNPKDCAGLFKKQFMSTIMTSNPAFNIHVAHHEVAPSQHEFELKFDEPISMMDKLVLFKYLLRNFAKEQGLEVTYMPKPFDGMNGSGMHFHMSLWENDIPLFYENGDELSDIAKHFIAGVLEHSQEIALLINGTVNSYKRLVLGHEAPVFLVWGYGNRSASIRIPKYHKIKPERARIEVRIPDALNDHYLSVAAIIRAGMIGIEKSMEAPEPFQRSTYELDEEECEKLGIKILPRNLSDGIEHAKKGKILRELLGKRLDAFIKHKQKEWNKYRKHLDGIGLSDDIIEVTDWERERYFNM